VSGLRATFFFRLKTIARAAKQLSQRWAAPLRFVTGLAFIVLLAGISTVLALWISPPHRSPALQVHDALRSAYERGGVAASSLYHDQSWSRLYVFAPLTAPREIITKLGTLEGADKVHEVKPSESLFVFAAQQHVVRQVRIGRSEIDASCLTAGGRGWIEPHDRIQVLAVPAAKPKVLAAAMSGPVVVQRCLHAVPTG
jgi:hypothetical protein